MTLHYAIGQIIGDRDNQEDFCAIQLDGSGIAQSDNGEAKNGSVTRDLTAVLCDGMGGHNAGEIAAQVAATSFLQTAQNQLKQGSAASKSLLTACHEANNRIARQIAEDNSLSGMGTTLVGVRCTPTSLSWVSVGDSYLLLFRNRQLIKLNQDHSMRPVIEQMVSKGLLSETDADSHPDRNALRSALTGDSLSIVDRGVDQLALKAHDLIVIASDGIEVLRHDLVRRILCSQFRRLSKLAIDLVSAARRHGGRGQDNTTVLLIRVP